MRPSSPFDSLRRDPDRRVPDRRDQERTGGELPSRVPFRRGRETPPPDPLSQDLKVKIHRRLIDSIDLTKVSTLETEVVKGEIRRILEEMVMAEALPLSRTDRDRLVTEVQHEAFGLGPLEFLMADPTVSDILVNTHKNVYVERHGKLERTDISFR